MLDCLAFHNVSIKAPCHEVRAAILLQQSARRHSNPGLRRHLVVRVLRAAIVPSRTQFKVPAHTVKLENPWLKPWSHIELTAPDLRRCWVPRNDCFRASTARRCSYSYDVSQRRLGMNVYRQVAFD